MTPHSAYELFEELGRGANTVVYRSYDLSLGREVAIKELDEAGRRDPRHRERFLREAQFLAQFEHDNVLRVYSVDQERGWIIMELMKGTLASKINEGPSDPDLVRSVLKQTLDALAFLHDANPMAQLIAAQREVLLHGTLPDAAPLALVAALSLGVLAAGFAVFHLVRHDLPERV